MTHDFTDGDDWIPPDDGWTYVIEHVTPHVPWWRNRDIVIAGSAGVFLVLVSIVALMALTAGASEGTEDRLPVVISWSTTSSVNAEPVETITTTTDPPPTSAATTEHATHSSVKPVNRINGTALQPSTTQSTGTTSSTTTWSPPATTTTSSPAATTTTTSRVVGRPPRRRRRQSRQRPLIRWTPAGPRRLNRRPVRSRPRPPSRRQPARSRPRAPSRRQPARRSPRAPSRRPRVRWRPRPPIRR